MKETTTKSKKMKVSYWRMEGEAAVVVGSVNGKGKCSNRLTF